MTKLLEDVRPTDAGDTDAAWTKLLDDTSSTHKPPIIIGPAAPHPAVAPDAVKELLVTVDPETGKTQQTIDGAIATGAAAGGRRRESIFGTFHRQLRMSLKAVSETPGPLTR
uniref:Uncharacterized protein n=1 Tax=Anopheles maculatus TaxID=74869 RepID=A0A182SPW6_9DIPT